jgi:hypothetical protein
MMQRTEVRMGVKLSVPEKIPEKIRRVRTTTLAGERVQG